MKPYFIFFILFLAACSQEQNPQNQEIETALQDEVTLTEAQAAMAELAFGQVQKEELSQQIRCSGVLDVPPAYLATISPPARGFVKEIKVLLGQHVKKGEVLAVLQHPDYIQWQENYLEYKIQAEVAEKEYDRQKTLIANSATAAKTIEQVAATLANAKAKKAAIEAQLEMIGISPKDFSENQIVKQISVRAPFAGFISAATANTGKFLNPEDKIFEMMNLEHLHVELQIFEKDILKINKEQIVHFKIAGDESIDFQASVYLIGQHVNPNSRTVNVHCHLLKKESKLRPGMFVNAVVLVGKQPSLTLPESALVREGEQYFVFVKTDKKLVFKKIQVEVGIRQAGRVALVEPSEMLKTAQIVVRGGATLEALLSGGGEEE